MPKKIKVVDVMNDEVKNEELEPSVNEEVNEDITTPIEEVINETPVPDIEDTPKLKVKPRAKPRTKKTPVEVIPEIKEDVKEDVKEPKTDKVKKVVELVKCPKCEKMMSQKSLRYTHEQNCKGEVVKTEELPVKRRTKKEPTTSPTSLSQTGKQDNDKKEIYKNIVNINTNNNEPEIPEELKQEVIKTIQRTQLRMKMKEDNFNKLKMQIA